MSNYTNDTRLFVHPFTRQPQGGEVVVGRPETGTFLAMPPDAVDLLDWLAAGKTIGEVRELYQIQYGEVPDLPDFLGYMQRKGLVGTGEALAPAVRSAPSGPAKIVENHFEWIPQSFAKAIFSKWLLSLCGIVIALAVAVVIRNPRIVPTRNALYFEDHRTLYSLSLMAIGCLAVFVHEMGHLLAARALGLSSRLSIGHRLWILVAETDLTGLWSVPKGKRYLPILAGPIVDLVSASALIFILYGQAADWIHLGPAASRLLPAVLFGYMVRLLWQFFFFVRTDVYYLITTFFDCKNLMKDTEMFLRRQTARLFPKIRYADQHGIPEAEMRVIRAYSLVWLLGRALAFSVLFLVTIPVTIRYIFGLHATFSRGFSNNRYEFVDSAVFVFLSLGPMFLGMWLWIRSLVRGWARKAA